MPGPLGLKDVDFWEDPRRTEDEVQDRLIEEEFIGAVIDAPSRVPLARRASLPVVGIHAALLREDVCLVEALIATAVRLETHEVRVGRAYAPRDRDPSFPPPTDLDPGDTRSLSTFQIDLRERLRLPWEPGTWLVGFVLRERTTNRATVKLEGGGAGFTDPAVTKLLAAKRRAPYPQPIWPAARPGQALPAYAARPDSPPVPDAPGIALAVERLVKDTPDATAVLRGSFRLPALEREVVRPADAADAALLEALPEERREEALQDGLAWQDVGDAKATAVLPITLVVTGAQRPGPTVLALQVPSYDAIDATAAAPVVTGHFALDLRQTLGWDRLADQTSFIYALSGTALAGPAMVAVVDPRFVA